jgi:nicotinate phosphoribosyltransferase
MERRDQRLKAVRLDSGDLAYLAKQSRVMLDQAGLHYVNIAASNQLDEYVIRSLVAQGAPIDIFAVGTNLVTGQPDAALDGVYKLAWANGHSVIKLSETVSKITLPDKKQVWRAINGQGLFLGADAIGFDHEKKIDIMHHPFEPHQSFSLRPYKIEPLLHLVMAKGKIIHDPPSVSQTAQYSRERLAMLPPEYKRFENPHVYKVGISSGLKTLRDSLVEQYRG